MKTGQFIKLISIFILLFWGTNFLCGQSNNQSLLTNKEWVNQIPGKAFYTTAFFTDKERVSKLFTEAGDGEVRNFYYLSDEIVDKFQHDSVGKNRNGKYIVTLYVRKTGEEYVELDEILELSNTLLRTKHLRSGTILDYTFE